MWNIVARRKNRKHFLSQRSRIKIYWRRVEFHTLKWKSGQQFCLELIGVFSCGILIHHMAIYMLVIHFTHKRPGMEFVGHDTLAFLSTGVFAALGRWTGPMWRLGLKDKDQDNYSNKDNSKYLLHLGHWLQFWQFRIWVSRIALIEGVLKGRWIGWFVSEQNKMRSRLGAQCMQFFCFTARNLFFLRQKVPCFNVFAPICDIIPTKMHASPYTIFVIFSPHGTFLATIFLHTKNA